MINNILGKIKERQIWIRRVMEDRERCKGNKIATEYRGEREKKRGKY